WNLLDNINPWTFRLLKEKIRQIQPDGVVTTSLENFGSAVWLAARSLGVPIINVIHGYYLQCLKESRFKNGRLCTSRCIGCRLGTVGKKFSSRYVEGVIGVSRYILESHTSEGYFPNARQEYIYNPVESCV